MRYQPATDLPGEVWRPYGEGHEVSNLGRVRSVRSRYGPRKTPLLMRGGTGGNSRYRQIKIGQRWHSVHVLVLEVFVGSRPTPFHDAAHNNGNSFDNRLVNLRWATRQQNSDDKTIHGTHAVGERTGRAKLTADIVRTVRAAHASGSTIAELARTYGVDRHNMSKAIHGVTWKHIKEEPDGR